jgi:hypothetical protein
MSSTGTENKTAENTTVSSDSQTKTNPINNIPSQHEHSDTCDDPTHHHNFPTFIDPNDLFSTTTTTVPKSETSVKRKNKKNKQQVIMRTELIPGHRGDRDIDELVNFINSPTPIKDKKAKNKSTTN